MKVFALVISLFALFCNTVFASSITSNTSQSEILHDQEFTVQASLSIQASDATNYYLRGVFYKEGTSNYCGFTWNGGEWFSGPYSSNEGWKKFLKVSVQNNSWTGELKAKIDNSDAGCRDSGLYKFKIQRFNEGSGASNFDDQNELGVNIIIPLPTPTPTPTSKPNPTTKPTATPKPNPTSKPTIIPTVGSKKTEPAQNNSQAVMQLSNVEDVDEEVLGEESEDEKIKDPNQMLRIATESSSILKKDPKKVDMVSKNDVQVNNNPFIMIGGIVSLIGSCGILVMRKIRANKYE